MSSQPGSAKRAASGNISNSSDDEPDELGELSRVAAALPSLRRDNCTHGSSLLDNPESPSASSTSSGSEFVRPPGFTFHGQQIRRPKVKKKKSITQPLGVHEPTPPTYKHRREPLPMRMRALPQSFWQQPNQPVGVSPAVCHKVLPPLTLKDDEIDCLRPVTPPSDPKPIGDGNVRDKHFRTKAERRIIVNDYSDSMLSKLFENCDEKNVKVMDSVIKAPIPPMLSSRKVKHKKLVCTTNKTMLHGSDPYMVETLTDKLFPHLTLDRGVRTYQNAPTSIQLITLQEGDRSITLPSLCIEQNYSQMLSDLVPHL